MKISSSAVFNKLMLFVLKEADHIFLRMLSLDEQTSVTARDVQKSKRLKKVESLLKSFLGNSLHLLGKYSTRCSLVEEVLLCVCKREVRTRFAVLALSSPCGLGFAGARARNNSTWKPELITCFHVGCFWCLLLQTLSQMLMSMTIHLSQSPPSGKGIEASSACSFRAALHIWPVCSLRLCLQKGGQFWVDHISNIQPVELVSCTTLQFSNLLCVLLLHNQRAIVTGCSCNLSGCPLCFPLCFKPATQQMSGMEEL